MLFPYQLWAGFIFMLIFKNLSFKCSYCESISYNWNGRKSYDKDYEVIIYFKADSELNREYGSYAYYYFLEEEIPDFVAKDTKYTNYK